MSVRVRFAPSPTGYLHVGGLRTALYNYLFARHHGGVNILRVEDTDQTRFVEGSIENIMEISKWAGIEYDESPEKGGEYGPYTQSERFDLYREHAEKLIQNGTAYYAFDTAEEIDAMRQRQQGAGIAPKYDRSTMRNQYTLGADETARLLKENAPHVVRLKVPLTAEVRFHDMIRGDLVFSGRDIDDQILLKSDGFPTYHLANVVDDYSMKITHVIRGEEWLPSTPKHVLLYEAFGWPVPQFAHLPLLLDVNKKKLSKRDGDVAVEDFRKAGYFKEALINFVALLGWNPTADREIFSMEELIDLFSLEKANKAGAVFDRQKLEWMNSQYLRTLPDDVLLKDLMPLIEEAGYKNVSEDYALKVLHLVRERITKLNDVPRFADYMFKEEYETEEEYFKKHWTPETAERVKNLVPKFEKIENWNAADLEALVKAEATEIGVKPVAFIHALRLILTGKS
ncbi:MAG TPA: glutamate--tRNA ligase, partial [Patescibacteria group bacterium]|nr:glutamate--tRNA ligase [Patescibacteria group bacterium]